MKAKRCPFCNDHNFHIDCNESVYWVACLECGANGPTASEQQYAVDLWNGEAKTEEGHEIYTSLVTDPKNHNRDDKAEIA